MQVAVEAKSDTIYGSSFPVRVLAGWVIVKGVLSVSYLMIHGKKTSVQ